ncbi:DUF1848 domain-containing protein [Fusobacterium sp. MFO224]|uniref:DUF1848 domain-containing protein n=1 Tax=Fusobacterium sp. MFO224 TaxID=3378070 RepID=UPI00385325DF
MIVSVSRRTDIPAFYSEWFFNRLKDGFVDVPNPFNDKQISRITLSPNTVDCFVFWTKDATPMLPRLDELNGYNYYFQFTITPYGKDVELGVINKKIILESFKKLSHKIGSKRVILRYDPIFLNETYTKEYHVRAFENLCYKLQGYTEKCIISFIDYYKKTERNTKCLNILKMTEDDINFICENFSNIAEKYGIKIETCSEKYNLEKYGINHGRCIDDKLISDILCFEIDVEKDPYQREECGCVKSIDIGEYNTCKHNCLYCYANFNYEQVKIKSDLHDPLSSLLTGKLKDDMKIHVREMPRLKKLIHPIKQQSLF